MVAPYNFRMGPVGSLPLRLAKAPSHSAGLGLVATLLSPLLGYNMAQFPNESEENR